MEAAYEKVRGQRGDMKVTSNSGGKPGFFYHHNVIDGFVTPTSVRARYSFSTIEADGKRENTDHWTRERKT